MRALVVVSAVVFGACFPPPPDTHGEVDVVDTTAEAGDTASVQDTSDTAVAPGDADAEDGAGDTSSADTSAVDALASDTAIQDSSADGTGDADATPECETSGDCDHLAAPPCVVGTCDAGACVTTTVQGPCDDGDPCTTEDACTATGCVGRAWTEAEAVGWAALFDGPAAEYATGIAIHPSGDVTVVGSFEGTAELAGQSRTARGDGTQPDAFIARFAGDGTLKWVAQIGGPGLDVASHVVSDGEDATVGGWFQGTATFGAGASEASVTAQGEPGQSFLARYDAAGGLSMVRRLPGYLLGLERVSSTPGDIVVAGSFRDAIALETATAPFTINSAGGLDIFLARLDASYKAKWWGRAGSLADDGALLVPPSLSAGPGGEVTLQMSFGTSPATYRSPAGTFALSVDDVDGIGVAQTVATLSSTGELTGSHSVPQPAGLIAFATDALSLGDGHVWAGGLTESLQAENTQLFVERDNAGGVQAWRVELGGDSRYSAIQVATVGRSLVIAGTVWGGDLILDLGATQSPAISVNEPGSHLFVARYDLESGTPIAGVASPGGGLLSATEWRYFDTLGGEGAPMITYDSVVPTERRLCGTVSEFMADPGTPVTSQLPGPSWVGSHTWTPDGRFAATYCVSAARSYGCEISP